LERKYKSKKNYGCPWLKIIGRFPIFAQVKKAYLILGLVFFLSNIFVFDLLHLLEKVGIHREARAAMKTEGVANATVVIVSDLEELNWEIPGQEFEKDGKMFDVYGLVKVEQGYKLYVRSDAKETTSNQNWTAFNKSKEESSNDESGTSPNFQSFPFIKPEFQFNLVSQSDLLIHGTVRVKSLVRAVLPSIPIPPPEFC